MGGSETVCWGGVSLGFLHAGVALWCFGAWGRRQTGVDFGDDGPAISFLRPLKPGVPELRAKLEEMVRAARVGDQMVFGVDEGSEEEMLAEGLRVASPERDIAVVACRPEAALNMKISKLVQMAPHARHEHWLLADAEAVLDADFVENFRREWRATGVDALTAGYRIRGARTWPQRLDAAAVLLTLWPGLGVLWAWGNRSLVAGRRRGLGITLGACTGLRRGDLAVVGGWEAFGDELAEDNRLGAVLAGAGRRIGLSRHAVTLGADPLGWCEWWRHQRRVAITYRVANPLGFAGSIVTYGEFWSVLLIASGARGPGGASLVACWAMRTALAVRMSRGLDFRIGALPVVTAVATFVAIVCWWLSWLERSVWWGGRRWRVTFRGKISAPVEKAG